MNEPLANGMLGHLMRLQHSSLLEYIQRAALGEVGGGGKLLLAIYAMKSCPLPDEITPLELHIPIFDDLIISEGNENTLLPLPNCLFGAQSCIRKTNLGSGDVLNWHANSTQMMGSGCQFSIRY